MRRIFWTSAKKVRRMCGIITARSAGIMPYIHELTDWPEFRWDHKVLAEPLAAVRHRQGRLIGRMEGLGFPLRSEATLQSLTEEVVKSSEIERAILDREAVRSSIARRLGIDIGALTPADRDVEGVVEMMLDATQTYDQPLTEERLFGWHAALFPTGRSSTKRRSEEHTSELQSLAYLVCRLL